MRRKNPVIIILVLGALSTISPFSIDMYLPGFPAIAEDLKTTIARVELSLTSYFIGIGVGMLLYGPLLDRFGRRLPLYAGLVIYILASLGCAMTNSVDALIAMRFLQAIGGCAGAVASQTLVRDLFPVEKTPQAFSWITLVVAVSPIIAPTVGGYFTVVWGWHSLFIILAIITAIILCAAHFLLAPGKKADPSLSLKPKSVIGNFGIVIRQPQFLIYTLAGGIATSAPFAYIAGSADVFMNIYGLNEQQYGWIFAIVASVIIASSQLNHFILRIYKSEQVILTGLLIQTFLGIVLITGTWLGWYNVIGLTAMISLFLAAHGLVNPNATALSLAPFSKHTGSAASLLGSFRMTMGGIVSALVSALHDGTAMPMIAVMVMCVASSLIILLTGKNIVQYRIRRNQVNEDTTPII